MKVFIAPIATSHRCHQIRTFLNYKFKWCHNPHLDRPVEVDKNLKQVHTLKTLIISQPSRTLPIFRIAPLKLQLKLPRPALDFCQKYPLIFEIFRPLKKLSLPHVKLTSRAIALHKREESIVNLPSYRKDLAERLAKFLMLTGSMRVPLYLIDKFKFDLGLPNDYLLTLLPEYPEFFRIVDLGILDEDGNHVFGLELIRWREDLAVSVMEKRALSEGNTGSNIRFSFNLPKRFHFEEIVEKWNEEWQNLPYISPYENAFHLARKSDQADKWAVAVFHELLCLFLAKKAEWKNLFCLFEYLGFDKFLLKRAIEQHPGIFYVSHKCRAHTIILREAFKKFNLIETHPLVMIRYKYIWLMETAVKMRKLHCRDRRVVVRWLPSPVKTAILNERCQQRKARRAKRNGVVKPQCEDGQQLMATEGDD